LQIAEVNGITTGGTGGHRGRPTTAREGVCVLLRIQSQCDHRQLARLRSARTGEGARPHTGVPTRAIRSYFFSDDW